MTGSRAIVFDFDGVLADTERLHLAAFQDVFAPLGWTLDEAAYFDRYLGYDDRDLVKAFLEEQAVVAGAAMVEHLLADKARRMASRLAAGDALFPQAAACVRRVGARYRLAVASGALRGEILAVLDASGLTALFEAIVGADDVTRSKPAPEPYTLAVERLGVPPEWAVAVEDSRWGLMSASIAGLRTIGITTSYPAADLGRADAIIDSLDDLTDDVIERVLRTREADSR